MIRALERAGVRLDVAPAAYRSAWRRSGLVVTPEPEVGEGAYARSPRSTRGARRA